MKIGYSSAVLKDLSKKDEGTFSVSLDGESHRYEIFRLKVNGENATTMFYNCIFT